MPRRYLGKDIWHWLNELGDVDRKIKDAARRVATTRAPSLSLTGANGGENLDLGMLHSLGVVLAGRLLRFDRGRAVFGDDLAAIVADADARMRDVLERIDALVEARGGEGARHSVRDVRLPAGPMRLDPADEGIAGIVWATGYRRDYRWLHLPVLDERGEIRP